VTLPTGVAISLVGVHLHQVASMLLGAIVAGVAFGTVMSGTMRTLLPLAGAQERAGPLSAYYVIGYLAFSLPAILVGVFAPRLGLPLAATIYGGIVILLAAASLVAMLARPARGCSQIQRALIALARRLEFMKA
jgi:hypothetical protein